jgi:predicted nucleotidyltransferase component of viral defense system
MNFFDRLVDEALKNQPDLAALRMVVEKELLHHDILRVLSHAGILRHLTFIGGTCLRACYGSDRLSEDLDFTGGKIFNRKTFAHLAETLIENLSTKYGSPVEVTEPIRETGNVDTWKIKVQTRPGQKDLPRQRINIDICAIPSYQPRPMMLLNPYHVEMGTSGLILQVESREEIFADKIVALALRPNRIKYRDLWDLSWLHQRGVQLLPELIPMKLNDHHCDPTKFLSLLNERRQLLKTNPVFAMEFQKEMRRFLPVVLMQTIEIPVFWEYLVQLIDDISTGMVLT